MFRPILFLVFTAFLVLSGYAVWQYGYFGIISQHFHNAATLQVMFDLVISVLLLCVWMVKDARAQGRNPWPFVGIALVLGSIGPMCYLLFGQRRAG